MALTLGSIAKESVFCQVKKAQSVGLTIDKVTDMAILEHLIQYWDWECNVANKKFLGVHNILESSISANAATISRSVLE